MPTYDELVAANAAIRKQLDSGVEERLRAIPGVVHVSVGLKERASRATDTLCIRVYVRAKYPNEELAPEERIPEWIDGTPTDVLVVRQVQFNADTSRYRPVKGGTMISNRIIVLNPDGSGTTIAAGTFGCTATRITDGDLMLLSNWHILMANGADIGSPIFQPPQLPLPALDAADLPQRPSDDTDKIGAIAGYAITSKVDAAIARLDVSSCCRCCGIDWRDEVVGLSEDGTPPSDRLLGLRAAVSGATVYKVGVRTGRTVGRVLDTDRPDFSIVRSGVTHTFSGQIEIASEDTLIPFSQEGDSGAAIVDEDGFIVGLHFASNGDFPPDDRSIANHISDVCSALGITINLDRTASDTAGTRTAPRAIRPSDAEVEVYAAARERVLAHPAGAWLWGLAERHRDEVVELVTHHRPVSVAWHRAGGPALFASAMKTLRSGGDALPVPADGRPLAAALTRIADALRKHGSSELDSALDAYSSDILAAVHASTTFSDLLMHMQPCTESVDAVPAIALRAMGDA